MKKIYYRIILLVLPVMLFVYAFNPMNNKCEKCTLKQRFIIIQLSKKGKDNMQKVDSLFKKLSLANKSQKIINISTPAQVKNIKMTITEYNSKTFMKESNSILVVRKTGSFSDFNCQELVALRKSNLVNSAGPVCNLYSKNYSFFTNEFALKFKSSINDSTINSFFNKNKIQYKKILFNVYSVIAPESTGKGICKIIEEISNDKIIQEVIYHNVTLRVSH